MSFAESQHRHFKLLHDLPLQCHLTSHISLYIDFQMLPTSSLCIEIHFKSTWQVFRMFLTYPLIWFAFVYTTFPKTQYENQKFWGIAASPSNILNEFHLLCYLDPCVSLYIDFQMLLIGRSCIEICFKTTSRFFGMLLTSPPFWFTFLYTTFSKTQNENHELCGIATSASKLLHDLLLLCHLTSYISLCSDFQMLHMASGCIRICFKYYLKLEALWNVLDLNTAPDVLGCSFVSFWNMCARAHNTLVCNMQNSLRAPPVRYSSTSSSILQTWILHRRCSESVFDILKINKTSVVIKAACCCCWE